MTEFSKKWTLLMIKNLIDKGFNYKCYIDNNQKEETVYDNELMVRIKNISSISKTDCKNQKVVNLDDHLIVI